MLTSEEQASLDALLAPFLSHPDVPKMKNFIQHGTVTTYDHVMSVVKTAYEYAVRHCPDVDLKALVCGALLHDFYLYDWHEEGDGSHHLHGFHHPKRAMENACARFPLTEKEKQIIYCHMWPLTPARFPKSKEGWIVTVADKIVSTKETLDGFKNRLRPTKSDAE